MIESGGFGGKTAQQDLALDGFVWSGMPSNWSRPNASKCPRGVERTALSLVRPGRPSMLTRGVYFSSVVTANYRAARIFSSHCVLSQIASSLGRTVGPSSRAVNWRAPNKP